MDFLITEFNKKSKALLSQYGFKKQRNIFGRVVFGRIVNDVYQDVYIEKWRSAINKVNARVGFGIIPLCQELDYNQVNGGMGLYYLKEFEVGHDDRNSWNIDSWEYSINSISINVCIDDMLRYIECYLIPFFERARSCSTAFQETINIEKLFYKNYQERYLALFGRISPEFKKEAINLYDRAKFYMALKNGDFDFALKSSKALEQQNLNSFKSVSKSGCLTEENKAKRLLMLEKRREEIEHLELGDKEYFQHLIEKNEDHSREVIKKVFRN